MAAFVQLNAPALRPKGSGESSTGQTLGVFQKTPRVWTPTDSQAHAVNLNPAVDAFRVFDVIFHGSIAVAADEQLLTVIAESVLALAAGHVSLVDVAQSRCQPDLSRRLRVAIGVGGLSVSL